jgi:hypothetical protein
VGGLGELRARGGILKRGEAVSVASRTDLDWICVRELRYSDKGRRGQQVSATLSVSAGVANFKVFRGRPLSCLAIALSWAWL